MQKDEHNYKDTEGNHKWLAHVIESDFIKLNSLAKNIQCFFVLFDSIRETVMIKLILFNQSK